MDPLKLLSVASYLRCQWRDEPASLVFTWWIHSLVPFVPDEKHILVNQKKRKENNNMYK